MKTTDLTWIIKKLPWQLIVSCFTLILNTGIAGAQYSTTIDTLNCVGGTTTFIVDLSASGDSNWVSPPQVRAGSCCGTDNNCVQFVITLAPTATGINFTIPGGCGASPSGSLFYQVNCGPLTSVGSPICLNGTGPHILTFCKPGNNANCYSIQSIPSPATGGNVITADGCTDTLKVTGLIIDSIHWNSISPGNYGDYNGLLSNLAATDFGINGSSFDGYESVVVSPGYGAPSLIAYEVCGTVTGFCATEYWCDTVTVSIYPTLFAEIQPQEPAICSGGMPATLTANPIGGTAPYYYLWTTTVDPSVNGLTTQSIDVTIPGEYIVQIYDITGCPYAYDTVTVIEYSTDIYVTAGSDISVCSTPVPQIQLVGSSPVTGEATWTGYSGTFSTTDTDLNALYTPSTQELINGFAQLILESTNNLGCPGGVDTVLINLTTFDASVDLSVSDITCNGSNNGMIDLTVTGSNGPYTYFWSTGVSTEDVSDLSPGTYNVLIKDANGCLDSVEQMIDEPLPLSISSVDISDYNGYSVSCDHMNDGSIALLVDGGTQPYTYDWTTVDGLGLVPNTEDQNGLIAGSYKVIITDANGCEIIGTYTLTEPDPMVLSLSSPVFASGDNISCFGLDNGSIDLVTSGGIPGYTYLWSTLNGSGLINGQEDQNDLTAGLYTVTLTDGNGCVAQDSIQLTEPLPLTIASTEMIYPSGTNISCFGANDGSIDISVNGGSAPYGFSWTTNGGTGIVATQEDQVGLSGGLYTVVISDLNGCKITLTDTLKEPAQLLASGSISQYSSGTNISCFGMNDGSIDITVNGGNSPYSFNWSTLDGSGLVNGVEDQAALSAGTYDLTVLDVNGCTDTLQVVLVQPEELSVIVHTSDISCAGLDNGVIGLMVSGGNPGYMYNWSTTGGSGLMYGSQDQVGLTAGIYVINVTDTNGCTFNDTISLNEPSPLNINSNAFVYASGTNVSCFGANDGSIDVTVSGGTMPYNYSWTTNGGNGIVATQEDQVGLSGGMYTVVISDLNGCKITLTDTLKEPGQLLTNESVSQYPSGTNISCFGMNDGSIDITVNGGNSPYSLNWFTLDGSGLVNGVENQVALSAGTYDLTVLDVNGCTDTLQVVLVQPEELSVIVHTSDISCAGLDNGVIGLMVSGGNPGYMYNWSTIGGSGLTPGVQDQVGLTAGEYIVAITDINGCASYDTLELIEPSPLNLTATLSLYPSGSNISCFGANDGAIDPTVTGGTLPYSFTWTSSNGSGLVSDQEDQSELTAGEYTLVVQDPNGCKITETYTLIEPSALSAPGTTSVYPSGTNISCSGLNDGSIDIDVNGGSPTYAFNWSTVTGSGLISAAEDQSGLTAGAYKVVITDLNGCELIEYFNLLEPDPIVISANISVYPSGDNISCNGANDGSIDITVSGGNPTFTYNWSEINGSGIISINEDQDSLTTGTYEVTVTDINGCSSTISFELKEPDPLTISDSESLFPSGANISCFGASDGSIDLTTNGGSPIYTYNWNALVGSGTDQDMEDQNGLTEGIYEVIVTDINGCMITDTIELHEPLEIAINENLLTYPSGDHISCFGASDGTIIVNVSGGSPDYVYNWTSGSTTISGEDTLSDLPAGSYNLIITDVNGCSMTEVYTLSEPDQLIVSSSPLTYPSGTNISCYQFADGSVDLAPGGGSPTYSYQWSTMNGSGLTAGLEDQAGLTAGMYTVVVTDINGCQIVDSILLTQPDPIELATELSAYPSGDNISCFGYNDGWIDLSVTGGNGTYSYNWLTSNGSGIVQGSEDQTSLTSGTYVVTVIDLNGCEEEIETTLVEPESLAVSINILSNYFGQAVSCEGANDGQIEAVVNGGSPGFTFTWNTLPVKTYSQLLHLTEGTYTVQVVDTNGCISSATVVLEANPNPVADPGDPVSVCLEDLIQLQSSGNANSTCEWVFSNGMQFYDCHPEAFVSQESGCSDLWFTMTNEYGCKDSLFIPDFMCVHPNPVAAFHASTYEVTFLENEVIFTNNSTNASEYEWFFGDGDESFESDPDHLFNIDNADGSFEVYLYAYNEFGCYDSASTVIHLRDELLLFIPNTFTPDGDQYNNVFLPVFGSDFAPVDYSLQIYDRWGELIFESSDITYGWDGTYNGNSVQQGTYTWKIRLETNENIISDSNVNQYTGHINLIR